MTRRVLFAAVAVVAVAIGAVMLLVVPQVDGMVAAAVERHGSAVTGTDVAVGSVDVALREGRATVDGLTFGNPPDFATDYALRIDEASVVLDLASLSRDTPVVTEMVLNGAHLNAEQRGSSTNLAEIQEHMTGAAEAEPGTGDEAEGRIIIERFRLTGGTVTVTSELLDEPELLELEDVVVTGIGRDSGGATYTEAAETILAPIVAAARSAAQNRLRQAAGDAAREEIEEEAGERLRELLERD